LITTLIPTYRRPKFLERALISVLDQDFPHICAKVLDNCSCDNTFDVVNTFISQDSRIKYQCNKKNIGAIGNFISAFDYVETPFFSLLSDDDFVMPGFYSKAYQVLKDHPRARFAVFRCIIAGRSFDIHNIASKKLKAGFYEPPKGFEEFVKFGPRTWTAILFRSSVLEEVRPDPSLFGNFDVDFLLRLAAKFPYVVHDSVGAAFFMHPDSYTEMGINILKDIKGRQELYKRIVNDYHLPEVISSRTVEVLKRNFKRRLIITSINNISIGDQGTANEILRSLRKGGISCEWLLLGILISMGPFSLYFSRLIKKTIKQCQKLSHYRRSKSAEIKKQQLSLLAYIARIDRLISARK